MKIIMHATKQSLPEKDRIEIVNMLNISLASANDLYAQLKQAHWNIKEEQFISLHLLFDTIAKEIEEQVDIIAERITSLGGTALGTSQATIGNSKLRIYPTDIFKAKDHIEHLTHNFSILGELSRKHAMQAEKLGDMGTSDLYIALSRLLDKKLWFLEAHIQK